jgi:hypothetical protein
MSKSASKRCQKRTLLITLLITLLVLGNSFPNTHSWGPLRLISRVSSPSISASSISNIYGDRPFLQSKAKRLRYALRRIVPFRSSNLDDIDATMLKSENSILRDAIRQLEEENQLLKKRAQRVVGLENFEGERYFRDELDSPILGGDAGGITLTGEEIAQDELWCDELEGGELYYVLELQYSQMAIIAFI